MGKHGQGRDEPILDPGLQIIDTHHHLFIRPGLRYMFEDYVEDAGLGHDIRATVYVETRFMARCDGPEPLRPLGEVEFANGMGAMGASGFFGPCRVAAAIVGHADLARGVAVGEVLDAMMQAAPERFRGIRQNLMEHPDPAVFASFLEPPEQGVMGRPLFREGFRELGRRGLVFDAAVLDHQLPDLARLAAENPDTTLVLNHLGMGLCRTPTAAARAEVFAVWRDRLAVLAREPNVVCKIGGLGTTYWGFGFDRRGDDDAPGSGELAEVWAPYVETAVEAFGADRCMMESNYPPDGRSCGFVPLWNALKLVTRGCSADERAALFHGTAARVYGIAI